ncbi:hypothetical protein F4823DRAFT_114010 [Ustulina deusta]|nr:hypothetical protein F4823DRAFT_114010 [Ustulina deusta]
MRYLVTSQALCGAITASALAVPAAQVHRRVQHVNITSFKTFPTKDPQVFLDKADDSIREFFNKGMFNDGPMDEFGKWLDRPLAVLEEIDDKLELHFDNLQGQVYSVHNRFKDGAKGEVQDFKSQANKQTKNHANTKRAGYSLYDWGDLFHFPTKQTEQPPEAPDSDEDTTGDQTADQPTQTPSNDNTPKDTKPEQPQPPPDSGKDTSGSNTSSESKKSPDSYAAAPGSGTCNPSNPHVRFEWDSYSWADRTAFVKAIKCLQKKPSGGSQYQGAQNRYEDLVSVHRDMTSNIHQTAAFLVWHRYFVWVFEQMLREECGFDRAMPWWDETKHAGAFANSDVFSDAWFGRLPPKPSDGQGTCIESGEFSGTTLHVGPGPGNIDHCLSRAVDESQTAQCNKDFTNSCLAMSSYDEFRDCFELGPHGYGHNGIGAVMAEVSASVGDPIFFMHHLFVDHVFRIWQNAMPSRRTAISGCADKADPCTPITLDTKLSTSGLRPDVTVGEVLNTLSGTFCYRYDY